MKLYEIKDYMIDTLDIFLESDRDEVDQELYEETMRYLSQELQNKSSKLIRYIANLEGEAIAVKLEMERLAKIRKARESKVTSLKRYLVEVMKHLEKSKVETELGSFGIRKSTSLDIIDINQVPEVYLKTKKIYSVDKREVTKVLKDGGEVMGTRLVTNYNLQLF